MPITTLFLDVGGVLLSNGWDHHARRRAARRFQQGFVHLRKPDAEIFRLALDVVQEPARQIVYIEDTPMFVAIAEGLRIRSILHTDYESTCGKLASFGLANDGAT